MIVLPVSGVALAVREPTGADEIYVLETSLASLLAMLELARRVTSTVTGTRSTGSACPATDLDATALILRRQWIGDVIRTDTSCPGLNCRERIDVSFAIGDYLRHHRPRRPRNVIGHADPGWFMLAGTSVRFRLPTIADLLAASGDQPADELLSRCVDASRLPRPWPGGWTARCRPWRRTSMTLSAGAVPTAGTR